MKKTAPIVLLISFGLALCAYTVIDKSGGWISSIAYLLPALLSVLFAGLAVRTYGLNNAHAQSFLLLGVGFSLWSLGSGAGNLSLPLCGGFCLCRRLSIPVGWLDPGS